MLLPPSGHKRTSMIELTAPPENTFFVHIFVLLLAQI